MKSVTSDKTEYEAFKPLMGTRGQPPFYDPNDLHVHVWIKGKLPKEEDPKVPTYNQSKISIKDCTYCKVCHKVRNDFFTFPRTYSTLGKQLFREAYSFLPIMSESCPTLEKIDEPITDPITVQTVDIKNLFMPDEGIIDGDYVTIKNK